MKAFAIITLAQPLSRSGSDRWGQFLRTSGEKEHFWLGRKLTPEEFNSEFPKALRFAGPDRPLVGRILVEPDASDGEGDSCHTMSVAEHEAKIAEIQAGVDAWVAEHNQKLEAAAARIAELECLLPAPPAAEAASLDVAEETIPDAPEGVSLGSDPAPAGAQVSDQPDSLPESADAPAPAKKAKAKAK